MTDNLSLHRHLRLLFVSNAAKFVRRTLSKVRAMAAADAGEIRSGFELQAHSQRDRARFLPSSICRLAALLLLLTHFPLLALAADLPPRGVGAMVPDWHLINVDGMDKKLSDYRGKVVFMNFWASWCAPCKKELPSIVHLSKHFQSQDFVVILVSLNKKFTDDVTYAITQQLPFEVVHFQYGEDARANGLDAEKEYFIFNITSSYDSWAIPRTIVVDRGGRVAYVDSFARDWTNEIDRIAEIIGRHD